MKKILLLFAAIGALTLSSCSSDDDFSDNSYVDNDTVATVTETTISFNNGNSFSKLVNLDNVYPLDMVLVYRQGYDAIANTNVWELTPRNYNFDNGDVIGYDFNFTQADVLIYMLGNFDLSEASGTYTQNQVFRIVVIPGSANGVGKMAAKADFKDYNAVIKAYGIDESNVIKK